MPQAASAGLSDASLPLAAASPPPAPPTTTVEAGPAPFELNFFDDVLQLIDEKPQHVSAASPAVAANVPPVVAPPPINVVADSGSVTTVAGPPPIPPAVLPAVSGVSIQPPLVRSTTVRHVPKQPSQVLVRAREAFNVRNGLVTGLVVSAFVAGWLAGRTSQPKGSSPVVEPPGEPVPLEGRVLYSLSPGHSLSDKHAMVIALPAGKKPAKKIDVRGLQPADEDDLDALPAGDALRSLGGMAVRADEQGGFVLVVPRPGNYWVLIISRHASRPEELALGISDAKELSEYFTSPNELIGQRRYSLSSRRLAGSPSKLVHEFGPTDKQ